MREKILVITSCSKKKARFRQPAISLYRGQFFKKVREFCRTQEFDLWILSGKHGLISSKKIIKPYDKIIEMNEFSLYRKLEMENIFIELLNSYDKILLFMSGVYRKILHDYLNHPKIIYLKDNRGMGGYNQLISRILKLTNKGIDKLIRENGKIINTECINDLINQKCFNKNPNL